MSAYKYQPYYSYSGPSRSDPFREQLSEEEVEMNMRLFFDHLDSCFLGTDAVVENDGAGTASISTSIPESQCDEIIVRHLNTFDLFAHKIRGLSPDN